jgi:predicted secreted protein
MAKNGTAFLLYVHDGANYVAVGSTEQRSLDITETTAVIDTSAKAGRSSTFIAGRYSSTLSIEALYVPNDGGIAAIKSANRLGEAVIVRVYEDGAAVEQATCIVTSVARSNPAEDNSTYAIDLQVTGAWSAV